MARGPRPRFLALGQGNGHGYVSTPLRELPLVADEPETVELIAACTSIRDEPEAIGPAILDDYAAVNRRLHTQQHVRDVLEARDRRPGLPPEARVLDLRRRARCAHVDLSHELHLIGRDLDRARLAGRMPPKRALDRLERLEALLDGVELFAA